MTSAPSLPTAAEIVAALDHGRLADFGVTAVAAYDDVIETRTDDWADDRADTVATRTAGRVLALTVNPELWALVTDAPEFSYPTRQIALWAEVLGAVQLAHPAVMPRLSEPMFLAQRNPRRIIREGGRIADLNDDILAGPVYTAVQQVRLTSDDLPAPEDADVPMSDVISASLSPAGSPAAASTAYTDRMFTLMDGGTWAGTGDPWFMLLLLPPGGAEAVDKECAGIITQRTMYGWPFVLDPAYATLLVDDLLATLGNQPFDRVTIPESASS